MTRTIAGSMIAVFLLATTIAQGQRVNDEKGLWVFEKTYWDYVQANEVEKYRALFLREGLAWPPTSSEPAHTENVTDWITAHTSKGESLKAYELEPLAVNIADNVATTMYRVRLTWADKNGAEKPVTVRIIHTLRRSDKGEWQVLSAMGSPANAEGR